MSALSLEALEKVFPGGHRAVAEVNLVVAEGELVVLLGPSGCGKSTLLRMVAGIEIPSRGRVRIDSVDVTDLPPQRRDVAMVFQSYALYPHMTVAENLAFGLKMRRTEEGERKRRVLEVAEKLNLLDVLDRRPFQLSGGQRQRVALGRAIVRRAKVFLMDEPLSNLDVKLRVSTRTEIARLQKELRVPMLYVTHDQEEAMTLGDRVVVMDRGRILQVGSPREIYLRPTSAFVAGFVGSPAMNFLPGELLGGGGGRLRIDGCDLSVALGAVAPGSGSARPVVIGVRPEDIEIVGAAEADGRMQCDRAEPLGREWLLHGRLERADGSPGEILRVLTTTEIPPDSYGHLGLRLRRDRIHLFDPETGERVEAAAGSRS